MPTIRSRLFLLTAAYILIFCSGCVGPDLVTSKPDPSHTPDPPGTPPSPSQDPDSIPSGFKLALQEVAAGLSNPLALASPRGDSRLFLVEKAGRIRIMQNGQLLVRPFLDIQNVVRNSGEQGLLGLAFHPDYAANGFFFVYYIGADEATHLVRYTRSTDDANVADAATAHLIMSVPPHASNHNGGNIVFAPDGMLLIGLGDGGVGGAGDRTKVLGSLLRIDINHDPYAIPPDNPYAGHPSFRPEIWAYGLRNPWRYSIDRQTGMLYLADVGQSRVEEVDVRPMALAGVNYGWSIMEGDECYSSSSCDPSGLSAPVLNYTHSDGCSVIGGFVYRGSAIPEIRGRYFYSDYCANWLRSFRYLAGAATETLTWDVDFGGQVLSFGEDAEGELYLLSSNGKVYRLVKGS